MTDPKRPFAIRCYSPRLLIGVGLLCSFAITFLVSEIVSQLRAVSTASSDNVHWVLSQTEVEYHGFRTAVESARRTGDAAALDKVTVEFDLFYSRMITLDTGSQYSKVRAEAPFGDSVALVRARLDALVPLIDGPTRQLLQGLDHLAAEADAIKPVLRRATISGLHYFTEQAIQSRESIAETLLRLAALLVSLICALILMLAYNRRNALQAEQRGVELGHAHARLHTILETSLDAVIVSDLDGRILNFNSAAERIFQHSSADVLGRNLSEVLIPDHLRAAHDAGMRRMQNTGTHTVIGHGRIRLEAKRGNGEVFPVEMALEKAETGEGEMVVAFLRDISQEVASEAELVEARDKALAGEKAKAEFLAMMTHEIRTPLNGLLGNLALLENTRLSRQQARYVRNMDISGGVLMHHVDSVLDVARFEAGKAETNQEVVHLGHLLQNIVDGQASAAEANDNHIQWGWEGAPMEWVKLDATRLQQVLLNLVGNAIKFTKGGRILIEAEQSQYDSDGASRSGLQVRVIDSGIGISEADQQRIFDDFQVLGGSGCEEGTGTGLGLGIARRFITSMGGEIGCESTPGDGSVFWLHIPVTRAEPPLAVVSSSGSMTAIAAPTQACDILLVEDNEINLELANEMLTASGHKVTIARDGLEAVAAASARRFDLILMDIRMPRLDGLSATRTIRASDGPNREAPFIAFSANVLPEAKTRFVEAGMSGFLAKPLKRADLQEVIAKFCKAPKKPRQAPVQTGTDMDDLCTRYEAEIGCLFAWLGTAPKDHDAIAERAHKLAGSAAAFGQADLRDALVALERAAECGSSAAIASAIEGARKTWRNAPEPALA